jgi:hypothetical protein
MDLGFSLENLKYGEIFKIAKAMDLGFLLERASCWNLELSETRYQKKKPKSYGSWILF